MLMNICFEVFRNENLTSFREMRNYNSENILKENETKSYGANGLYRTSTQKKKTLI